MVNSGPECARCEMVIFDFEIDEMVHDMNENSQYHRDCWRETGKVAWKVEYGFKDLRIKHGKSRPTT